MSEEPGDTLPPPSFNVQITPSSGGPMVMFYFFVDPENPVDGWVCFTDPTYPIVCSRPPTDKQVRWIYPPPPRTPHNTEDEP